MENKLGDRMKELRTVHGWTQKDVADKLGVTSASISSWESGSRRPDFETLDNMSDLFKASFDYLFGRSDVNTYYDDRLESLRAMIDADEAAHYEKKVADMMSLDYYGRCAVEALIDSEYKRCKEQETLCNPDQYTIVLRMAKKKMNNC